MHIRLPFHAALALLAAGFTLGSPTWALSATYYVDSAGGNDTADGLSQATAWKTLDQVNNATLQAGDTVLFNRGGIWRGALKTRAGVDGARITYAAYGAGDKPRLYGSATLASQGDWLQAAPGSNIWVSQVPTGANLINRSGRYSASYSSIPTAVFATDSEVHSPGAASSIKVSFTGAQSTAAGDVQLYSTVSSLTAGRYYKLTFKAKASEAVTLPLPGVTLFKNGDNFGSYGTTLFGATPRIGTDWDSYEVYFKASSSATDGRVNLMLGKIKAGVTINLDSFSFAECADGSKILDADVGNLIFDESQALVGTKVLNEADLDQEGEFWYDSVHARVKLYSSMNPALAHPQQLEAALNHNIISAGSDVEVRDLDLRFGGAHGVGTGSGAKRAVFDGLDVSFIGGSLLSPGVRYGNGIQIWESAENVVVRNSRLKQIYDVALTAQGLDHSSIVNGVTFTNNYAAQSEQCFELWNRYPAGSAVSTITGITFSHNTCVGSGTGWSHAQRSAQGYDLLMYVSTATSSNIQITDNVFYGALNAVVRIYLPWEGYQSINFSGNCYYPQQSTDATLGLIYAQTGYDQSTNPALYTINTKSAAVFNSAFASNTSASSNSDPQMIAASDGLLRPSPVGGCSGKGYAAPSGS